MRIRHPLAMTVTTLGLAVVVAACGGTSPKVGTGSAVKGTPEQGGTVTVAEASGASPNDIFPVPPATNSNGYNENLTMGEWPYLVYTGDGAKSVVNPQESLYSSLTWSRNDSVITIVLKPWKWSDGVPITSRDFTFVYNLLKPEYNDWEDYSPGLFPADVTKVATPNTHTVVISLNRSYNPSFYVDDVLNFVPLLPQHSWDKTSLTGKVGNYDETTAGAKAVWNFLQKQGTDMATFDTNPMWQVVDGPWKLSQFQSNGYYVWVPNKNYSGPDKPRLSKVVFTPFTTDTAEMDTLRSGTSLTVAGLPLNDVNQIGELQNEGYAVASIPTPGVAEVVPNLWNPVNGPLLRQLYMRQALEYQINRHQIVTDAFHGYADPGNGPVPVTYGQQWASPLEKAGGPYAYSPTKAAALLKAHGWKVVPNGTDTCQRPGTAASDCGAGVAAGQPLTFQLLYASGSAYFDQMNAAIQTSEAQAGIHITLKAEPFNTLVATTATCNAQSHPKSTCNWQLQQFGYQPYYLDPNGAGIFNTDAVSNYGGYSSPKMDQLINETEYGSSSAAFYAYEDYTADQLPWLWLPNQSSVVVYKKNLGGLVPASPFDFTLNPEVWYYVKPTS
ncbi:MAG TPA: ABC transporter substrate-binding protein [Streptosporangiaceae bacterium]|jgi:peptide/nickel transport system substrate-binding protein|nr:ABC transporter substrate-binding protein [Streptosporangiaceae bacterium]